MHASAARLHAVCRLITHRARVSLRHAPCGLIVVGVMLEPRNSRMHVKAWHRVVMTKRYSACCYREGDEEKMQEDNRNQKSRQRVDEATRMR